MPRNHRGACRGRGEGNPRSGSRFRTLCSAGQENGCRARRLRDQTAGRAQGRRAAQGEGIATPGPRSGTPGAPLPENPKLADLGISKKQSANWQTLADVPEEEFQAALADKTAKPSTTGIVRAAESPKPNPVSAQALWLWGRLRDLAESDVLKKDPVEVMQTLTDQMKDDVHRYPQWSARWQRLFGRQ